MLRSLTLRTAAVGVSAVVGVAHAQTQADVERAGRDFMERKPLPNLPDLKKPVFIEKAALVCESLNALANPNKDILIMNGMCTVTDVRQKVVVMPPRDQRSYMDAHVYKVVRVAWRSAAISDATVYSGWTLVSNINN